MAQMVKNLPTMQEKRMAIHFSILAWRIPWTEKPGGLAYGLQGSWEAGGWDQGAPQGFAGLPP